MQRRTPSRLRRRAARASVTTTTGGQFIYNWKTPTGAGCYTVTMTAADGSTITAYFKSLK